MTDQLPQTLSDIRAEIDAIDQDIIALIAARQQRVEAVGLLKAGQTTDAVRAADRVESVIQKVRGHATEADASPDVVEATYRAMIGAFIDLELVVHSTASK